MGSWLSGNRKADAKRTVNESLNIDVRRLKRDGWLESSTRKGLLAWTWTDDSRSTIGIIANRYRAEFEYTLNGQPVSDEASILWTPCHYGGERPWFQCSHCSRRIAILYPLASTACRICHRLAYKSQNETDCDQAARQAERIRKQLEWQPGILNGEGPRPTGMHIRTYIKLVERHRHYYQLFMQHAPCGIGG